MLNPLTEMIPFAVLGNSTIAMGADVSENSNFTPTAQVTIARTSIYDYMLKLQNTDQSADFFTVHNNGYVGIGVANSGAGTLQIKGEYPGTTLDLLRSSGASAIRFKGGTDNVRHLIADDANGDLLIDPGIANSGANDKLIVEGNTYLTKQLGVGVDVQTNSTLAVKGTSGTNFDLYETSTSVNYNAQLRFIGNNGTTVRHLITENSNGELFIDAGWNGNAADKLTMDGDLQIGNVKPTSSSYINSTNGENNLSVNGWVVAKKVIVETSNWSDKVFAADYNLKSLSELENFITANQHLPEIPSECEVTTKGIDVGEMNKLLLQKVEELTLYVIAQQKQIDALLKK